MVADLDAAEKLQTGQDPNTNGAAGADQVDGAGRPIPPGATFNALGMVTLNGKPLKGFKQRKDLMTVERGVKGQPKNPQTVIADSPTPARAADEEKPPPLTRARAEKKLAMRWGQLWDLCAEGWGDDTLRVTPDEEREWAEPVAYVMEQMGWLHHTEKLDWIGAAVVTGKQAGPRVGKMLANHPRPFQAHPDGQTEPPQFRWPAGMGHRGVPVGEPVRADTPSTAPAPAAPPDRPEIHAEGAGNPLPLDPLFMPREEGYDY
jgi:hypothetical protein